MLTALAALAGFVERLGVKTFSILMILAGAALIAQKWIDPTIALGGGLMAGGGAILALEKVWAKSEAEKRISDPNLPSSSNVSVIQTAITKIRETK